MRRASDAPAADGSSICLLCGASVPPDQLACRRCGRSLLFGLIADPFADGRRLEPAARALAVVAAGPTLGEARRRLAEGLPLAVGLSRRDAERLRDELVALGVTVRLGPAPPGTRPIGRQARRAIPLSRIVIAVLAVGAALAWLLRGPPGPDRRRSGTSSAVTVATPTAPIPSVTAPAASSEDPAPGVEDVPLDLKARLRWKAGQPILNGVAMLRRVTRPPRSDLELTLLATDSRTLVWQGTLATARAQRSRMTTGAVTSSTLLLRFAQPLGGTAWSVAENFTLEARWDDWTVQTELQLPDREAR
jgi:hypothetical protein